MKTRTPFLTWVWRTQRLRLLFINAFIAGVGISLATDRPTPPWDAVGWCFMAIIPAYWCGNYWYWSMRLDRGTKC